MDKHKVILIVFCIFLPIFLLLFSYKTVLFFSDLAPDQKTTLGFLQGDNELSLNYTSLEASHLDDVKQIMTSVDYFFYLVLLICALIVTHYKKNQLQLQKLFLYGGITSLVFISIKILFALFSFNFAFTIFHNLFFPQGNWIFPQDSLIIRTFPLEFFVNISIYIFLFALIIALLIVLASWYWRRKKPS